MAYSQENLYLKNSTVPRRFANVQKRPYDQAHTNNLSGNANFPKDIPVNLSRDPSSHAQTPLQAAQHLRPPQSIQVVIPSPRQPSVTTHVNSPYASAAFTGARSQPTPVDYRLLLLSLAEDYFAAAHGEGSMVALTRRQSDIQAYYKLIATGLGCLETALKHWRLQPLLEAKVRLRYAAVLHDETDNSMEAEEALSRGITICDRIRNFDLKYNMQHLLARVLHSRNTRASLRYLDGIMRDVEAYQHVAWIYSFRFLRVSLSLESSSHQDILSALSHLRLIAATSEHYGDKAVLAVAATLEASVYLRMSNSAESIEQAQRALAVARSSQLDPIVGQIQQLTVMTLFVDLCWTLRSNDPLQAGPKLQALQATLETVRDGQHWAGIGTFAIPIGHTQGLPASNGTGIVQDGLNGTQELLFDWLAKDDVYDLGFLLSGLCTAHKNTLDGLKSEQMLKEGIRRQDASLATADKLFQTASHAMSRNTWRQLQRCYLHLHLTFALCARTTWPAASDQMSVLKEAMKPIQSDIPADLHTTVLYLEGIIYQGIGSLHNALNVFLSPSLSLPEPNKSTSSQTLQDISILAALNALIIIRSRPQPPIDPVTLLDHLGPLCAHHPNKAILSAYNFVLAIVSSADTIVHTKQCLQNSLEAAKTCANNQLMGLTLNFMCFKFFKGVTGQQAEKSARASQSLSQKGKDLLWMGVSAGLLADTLDLQGRADQAEAVRVEGRRCTAALPESVQRLESNGA